MAHRIRTGKGCIAALDQSGGSTPSALRTYGIPETAYRDEDEMFARMHEMRVRVMSAPAFSSKMILAAILFERTMDGMALGDPVPTYLWDKRGIVPFLKIDKGLEAGEDGVRLMKPIPAIDELLSRASRLGVFGTKMRSVIALPSKTGIAAIAEQQFSLAETVAKHDLMPIIEPEILISSPEKGEAEAMLAVELSLRLDAYQGDGLVMLKLTIPETPDQYLELARHERVARVVALSGGYTRDDACARLARNHDMIASFSRALLDDLRCDMGEPEFDAALATALTQIYDASTVKVGADARL